jgi:hypothetical protein
MNITLSIDERLARRARQAAAALGKSLNRLIRDHLETVTAEGSDDEFVAELRRLSAGSRKRFGSWRFNRDEAHERP